MVKNLILGPILARLAQTWAAKFFLFVGFTSTRWQGIVTSCHCMQFQGKLMTQTQENGKKIHFGSELFSQKIWLHQSLDFMVNYYHVKYQKKLMIQSWENLVTEGWTNRRMSMIRRCTTNVEGNFLYNSIRLLQKAIFLQKTYGRVN